MTGRKEGRIKGKTFEKIDKETMSELYVYSNAIRVSKVWIWSKKWTLISFINQRLLIHVLWASLKINSKIYLKIGLKICLKIGSKFDKKLISIFVTYLINFLHWLCKLIFCFSPLLQVLQFCFHYLIILQLLFNNTSM